MMNNMNSIWTCRWYSELSVQKRDAVAMEVHTVHGVHSHVFSNILLLQQQTNTFQHLPTPSNTFQHLPTPANIPQHTSTDSWWTYWLHWPTHFWRTCYAHLSSRLQPTHSVMCSTVQPTSEGSGMTTTPHSQNWWDADSKLVKPLWNGVTIMEWDSCSSYQNIITWIITWIITCNIM